MSKDIGDMEYTNEEELHLGANYEDIKDNRISIEIIDPSESSEKNMDILEARRIAKIIKDLINQKYIVSENGSKLLQHTKIFAYYSEVLVNMQMYF